MASMNHRRTQHTVQVLLVYTHVIVSNRVLPVEPILHFLTLNFLWPKHGTIARTLLSNVVSRAESLFGILLAAGSTCCDKLSHICIHINNARTVIWSSWDTILSLGVGRAGSHVVIVPQYAILHSLLHIFLLASIFDVLRHRRVSRGTTLRQLSTRLRNVRYALRSLHLDHVDVGLIETVLNFLLLGEPVRVELHLQAHMSKLLLFKRIKVHVFVLFIL